MFICLARLGTHATGHLANFLFVVFFCIIKKMSDNLRSTLNSKEMSGFSHQNNNTSWTLRSWWLINVRMQTAKEKEMAEGKGNGPQPFSQDFLKKVFEHFGLSRLGSSLLFCACLTWSLWSRPHAKFKCGMQWNFNHYMKFRFISFSNSV